MGEQIEFGELSQREWLTCNYNNQNVWFAFPPAHGTHKEWFESITSDKELMPAAGLELVLLLKGAHTLDTEKWKDVKDQFSSKYIRFPTRLTWIPENSGIAGVLIERDLYGVGLNSSTDFPKKEDLKNWEKNEQIGIYISREKNQFFIPEGSYNLGRVNENDAFLVACLGGRGAKLFVKTAIENGKIPCTGGIDISKIDEPKQRVVAFGDSGNEWIVNGEIWPSTSYGYAFGVSRSQRIYTKDSA